ncbi:hypothetical protein SADUNF_Sadunf18G0085900 [Salix dunnii]|uniref:APO domain-containing protein n=1 Tax=Salix dunnii TaxID=1413687 RepID=A0A835J433_9ROSI|nr:hypothetical protein SADUNF_Sadunf18G0085900 [Salix dunnii]
MLKKSKGQPRGRVPPLKKRLVVLCLVTFAYDVFNVRIILINNLKKLLKVVTVYACGWCDEIHVGLEGHPFKSCKGKHAALRNGLHQQTNATIEDVLFTVLDDLIPPRYVWHVPGVVGLPLRRELRNFYRQAPVVVEICIQAGAAVPDQYKSTMRLDIRIISSVKEAEMVCPVKMAIGGVALVTSLGYFVLYSKKKLEAFVLDFAKVTTSVVDLTNTHPRN